MSHAFRTSGMSASLVTFCFKEGSRQAVCGLLTELVYGLTHPKIRPGKFYLALATVGRKAGLHPHGLSKSVSRIRKLRNSACCFSWDQSVCPGVCLPSVRFPLPAGPGGRRTGGQAGGESMVLVGSYSARTDATHPRRALTFDLRSRVSLAQWPVAAPQPVMAWPLMVAGVRAPSPHLHAVLSPFAPSPREQLDPPQAGSLEAVNHARGGPSCFLVHWAACGQRG